MPKLLILDIETSPNLAYVWGLWNQNVGLDQLVKATEMISWAAKWYGKKKIMFMSVGHNGKTSMLKGLWMLLDEADVVIHYNGRSFDMPIIRTDLLMNKIAPPSPVKQIDLIETAKRTFRFQSNRLEYLCRTLGIGKKKPHEGFTLWEKCMKGDAVAWKTMKEYNIQDVILTEQLYTKLKPWMDNHPYLYDNGKCPKCGSTSVTRQGYRIAVRYKYARFKCNSCAGWFQGERVT